jgi:AbrB family looped-hinge helix DNA binding protein
MAFTKDDGMISGKITRKGQVTIPASYRSKYGLREGDVVTFHEVNGKLVVEGARNAVRDLAGSLSAYAKGKPPLSDEMIDQTVEASILENYRRKLAVGE